MAEIAIVCGMVSEVRALGRWAEDRRVSVAISAAQPARAEAAARAAVATGARHLISWGLAGGLSAELLPGALIRPGAVILPDGRQIDAVAGDGSTLVGSDTVITDPYKKRALSDASGAVAVDMESHRLASVADEAGVPLTVIRAISDPAARALPALAAHALGPDGRPRMASVLAGLLRRPGDLPNLMRAGRDSGRALAALRCFASHTALDDALV